MKNIIPFKKDVIFKTNISEITSISLENTLTINKDIIKGEFIVSGDYKVSDKSISVDPFNLNLPFEIVVDEKYNTDRAIIDIDDFYYEIVNDNVLRIAIDVLVDKLEEKPLIEEFELVDETPKRNIIEDIEEDIKEIERCIEKEEIKEEESSLKEFKEVERCIEPENIKEEKKIEMEEKINSLFNQFSKESEVYVTYNVYIVRDGDTLESIVDKYGITLEELKKYNDLNELKLGDKLIIPNSYERD